MTTDPEVIRQILSEHDVPDPASVGQLVTRLNFTPSVVATHIRTGTLTADKVGNGYRINHCSLVAFFLTDAGFALLKAALARKALRDLSQSSHGQSFQGDACFEDEQWANLSEQQFPTLWNCYEVSTLGRVRRSVGGKGAKAGKILKPRQGSNGYGSIAINRKNFEIHRLVADKFVPNPSNHPQVHHLNGDRTDNRAENLEWVTPAQNMTAAKRHGQAGRPDARPGTKLNREQVSEIRSSERPAKELAAKFGIGVRQVFRIRSKEQWGDTEE